jgi:hypothetical protein
MTAGMRIGGYVLALAAASGAMLAAYGAWHSHVLAQGQASGSAEVQARWNAAQITQQKADLQTAEANARETQRRMERQKENQDVQDRELAAMRAAADHNGAAAFSLREQNAAAARLWRDALTDPASGSQCPAAADTIGVLADVLARADRRAGELASYADAARAAGLKCERDYDALTSRP